MLYAAAFFGLLFSFVLFLTSAWGLSTVEAGLGIVPMAGTVVALSFVVGHLPRRIGFGAPLAAGAALIALGLLFDVALQGGAAFTASWVLVAGLIGAGIALCYLLLGAAAVADLPAQELAAATAINGCARQFGAVLGVASAVAAIGSRSHPPVAHFHLSWLICAGFAAASAVAAGALGSFGRGEPPARVVLSRVAD